jgi:hypothetical protein
MIDNMYDKVMRRDVGNDLESEYVCIWYNGQKSACFHSVTSMIAWCHVYLVHLYHVCLQ